MCDGMTLQQEQRLHHWTLIHGIILTLVWFAVADSLILIVRYWKNWSKYLLIHSSFGLFNLASIFAIVIMMVYGRWQFFSACFFNMSDLAMAHSIIGMFILLMIVLIQVIGFIGKLSIQSKTKDPVKTMLYKKIHIFIGYFTYFLSKAQVYIGWWMKMDREWSLPLTVITIYTGLFFFIQLVFIERYHYFQNETIYVSMRKKLFDSVKYDGLLEMLSKGMDKDSIMREYPNIKYMMYKYKVYDVSNLLHPGGNYIIEKLQGEEISRYIHGAYGLESSKLPAYTHTIYAHKLLEEHYIGQIDTSSLGLMKPKIGDKLNVPTIWNLELAEEISLSVKIYGFQSERYNLSTRPNILYLGRHFLLSPISTSVQPLAPRLYTLTLCMCTPLRQFTKDMILRLENENQPSAILKQTFTTQLPFVIKKYSVKGFSEQLYNSTIGSPIQIQGPFGRGLQLSEGTFYAFCGGTGVLPLLDLIYQILLQIYFSQVEKKRLNRLPSNFKFILYLAIPKVQFLTGLQLITKTYILSKQYSLNIFDLHLRISTGESISNVPQFLPKLNGETIRNVIKDSEELRKVFVCGSPQMNYELYHGLMTVVDENKIQIM